MKILSSCSENKTDFQFITQPDNLKLTLNSAILILLHQVLTMNKFDFILTESKMVCLRE